MTNEQIRIKIAESLGLFRTMPLKRTTRRGNEDPKGVKLWYCSEHHGGAATYDEVPNYPESLDACAEFEKTLTELEFEEYFDILESQVPLARPQAKRRHVCSATSLSRCLAYVELKGL